MENQPQTNLTAVVALTPRGVIGRNGEMPWRLRSDLQRFKRLTMGGVLVMGRRTYESIGRPLPGRRTVVLSRDPNWTAAGVETASNPDLALQLVGDQAGYVVGGAEIYRLLLPACGKIFCTRVWSDVTGDTRLDLDLTGFRLDEMTRTPAGDQDDVPTEFLRWTRV